MGNSAACGRWRLSPEQRESALVEKLGLGVRSCACREGEFGCNFAIPHSFKKQSLLPNSISVVHKSNKDVPVAVMDLYG